MTTVLAFTDDSFPQEFKDTNSTRRSQGLWMRFWSEVTLLILRHHVVCPPGVILSRILVLSATPSGLTAVHDVSLPYVGGIQLWEALLLCNWHEPRCDLEVRSQ